jgi:hypothetical protein
MGMGYSAKKCCMNLNVMGGTFTEMQYVSELNTSVEFAGTWDGAE